MFKYEFSLSIYAENKSTLYVSQKMENIYSKYLYITIFPYNCVTVSSIKRDGTSELFRARFGIKIPEIPSRSGHPVDAIGSCRWLAGRPKLRRERILGARYAASGRVSTSTRSTNHGREHRCVPARPA